MAKISLVLDRRAFISSAAAVAGTAVVAARASWSIAGHSVGTGPLSPAPQTAGSSMEWDPDHIFGTYPPYAHPIPYGYQSAPPVSFDVGSFDPVLMI